MQLPPEEQEFIRRAFHVEHQTIRQIERETGRCRQALRRAISPSSLPTDSRNLCFGDWNSIFADPTLTTAFLDRLTHKGRIAEFVGESYRSRHRLQQEGA